MAVRSRGVKVLDRDLCHTEDYGAHEQLGVAGPWADRGDYR